MFSVVIIIEYSSIYCLQVLNLFTSNLHPCCKQKLSVIFNSKTEKCVEVLIMVMGHSITLYGLVFRLPQID